MLSLQHSDDAVISIQLRSIVTTVKREFGNEMKQI